MKLVREIPCNQPPGRLKFSNDGTQILTGDQENIFVYDLNGDLKTFPVEPFRIARDIAFLDDRRLAILGANMGYKFGISIYDMKTKQVISSNNIDIQSGAICANSKTGRIIVGAIASERIGSDIYVYDTSLNLTNTFISEVIAPEVKLSHDGRKLAIGGVFVEVWDILNEPKLLTEECPKPGDCTGTPCEANSIDITPDGRIAVGGFNGAQGICAAIDVHTGKVIRWFGPKGDEWNYYAARALSVSRDGKYIGTGFYSTTSTRFYEIASGEITHRYDTKYDGDIAFSPTDDIIAIGAENAIILWEYDG